jgi:TatD DNase family protein
VIDSHCHLADEAFAGDLDEVVARAMAAGLRSALCVLSMGEPGELARARRVAALWPDAGFAIGAHPHQAHDVAMGVAQLQAAVRTAAAGVERLLAIGEIGLDYHYDLSPRDVQREVFAAQVALARDMGRPVVVHTREAEADTREILEAHGPNPLDGVLHCFTGSAEMAAWAVGAGLHVSFAGIVTFPGAQALRDVARTVPVERLLVETDCPYLAPVPFRGKRNEPAHVTRVIEVLAVARGMRADVLAAEVEQNFDRLFGRDRRPVPGSQRPEEGQARRS